MGDRFSRYSDSVSAPARKAWAIVPSDSAELDELPKALLIGGSGLIALRAIDSEVDVIFPVAAGQLVPIRALYVRQTNTTATNIVGLA